MSDQPEKISQDDFLTLNQLKSDQEKASYNAKMAELMYENALLKIYLKYELTSEDGIDPQDGKIIREKDREKNYDAEITETEGTSTDVGTDHSS